MANKKTIIFPGETYLGMCIGGNDMFGILEGGAGPSAHSTASLGPLTQSRNGYHLP